MSAQTKALGKKPGGLSDKASDVVLVVLSVVVMLLVAYPLYYILVASFSDPYDVYAGKTFLLPSPVHAGWLQSRLFGRQHPCRLLEQHQVHRRGHHLLGGHDLHHGRTRFPTPICRGASSSTSSSSITMYFGGGLIPTYLVVRDTGLINTIFAMFLPGGVAVSNMIIARNYFETSIPKELKEAAEIDGASKLRIFWDIIIPLSRPIMAVMVVFSMVAYWNDWFTALIYMTGEGRAPLPLVLRNILIASETSASQASMISGGYAELNKLTESIKFGSIIVAAAPMLIIYPFVQKYFEQGFMAGAGQGLTPAH